MSIIRKELKLFALAFLIGMIGMQVGFHISEDLGVAIVFICIPIAGYAVIRGQIKFFRELKRRRKKRKN